jgi:hypothetical protein
MSSVLCIHIRETTLMAFMVRLPCDLLVLSTAELLGRTSWPRLLAYMPYRQKADLFIVFPLSPAPSDTLGLELSGELDGTRLAVALAMSSVLDCMSMVRLRCLVRRPELWLTALKAVAATTPTFSHHQYG